jgi:hypothetical protein
MALTNGPSARMETLMTTKSHIESQIMATAARLTAARHDEDRLAKRITRVSDQIYKLGANGDPTILAECSARLKTSEADLAKFVSRSKAIADEECALEEKIEHLGTEIMQLFDEEAAAQSQESTLRLEPADGQEERHEPSMGEAPSSPGASSTSAEDYHSVSGSGINGSAALSDDTIHPHAEPLSHDQTTAGTGLSFLYDDGLRREGTVTKVYPQTDKKGQTHEHATWRKISLTEGGHQTEWNMASKTKDGEVRTRIVRLPDSKPSPAPMALTGMPVTRKIGNPRTHSSSPRPVSANGSQSPGTPENSVGLDLSAIQLIRIRLALISFMITSKYNLPAQKLATYSPHRYRLCLL